MEIRRELSLLASHFSLRKMIIVGLLLAWALFSTIGAVPAPPPGGGSVGPT